ncbi:MAG: isoprenylcysteine carboxylmethyltransferase family protein [Candidatus Lokiarchaeota archaeon]|nr:isoprenylcysteine carboxylmethyltransferase family protein [Candidatus Lokiarchaeota archaeon]
MKGSEKLREKLPDYQGKSLFKFMIVAFITFLSSIIFQLLMDSISRIFSNVSILQILEPLTPIFGSLIIVTIGFLLIYSFWRSREKYLRNYGELAYQKAFKFVVTAVPMVISVMVHSFFPSDFIVSYENSNNLSWYFGTSIYDIFFNSSIAFLFVRLSLFFIFFGLGLAVVSRALHTFGIDYMALVYVYYPKESTLQNHEIYSILRHPTYHALMILFIGGIFLRSSIYSIIYFFIFLIGINLHLKFVEEKELIKRFGEGYKKYKKNVPALFVRFRDLKKYLSFIF